jgi:hypothetical protein
MADKPVPHDLPPAPPPKGTDPERYRKLVA